MYRTPIPFEQLLRKQQLPSLRNLRDSVEQHLNLLLGTKQGEYRYDDNYGARLWNADFDSNLRDSEMRQDLEQDLKANIERYETRLANVRVRATLSEQELPSAEGLRAKKQLSITVNGILLRTHEDFECSITLFLSPISFD